MSFGSCDGYIVIPEPDYKPLQLLLVRRTVRGQKNNISSFFLTSESEILIFDTNKSDYNQKNRARWRDQYHINIIHFIKLRENDSNHRRRRYFRPFGYFVYCKTQQQRLLSTITCTHKGKTDRKLSNSYRFSAVQT